MVGELCRRYSMEPADFVSVTKPWSGGSAPRRIGLKPEKTYARAPRPCADCAGPARGGVRNAPLHGEKFRGSRPLRRLAAATGRWQPEQGQTLPNINAWVGMWVEPDDRLFFPLQTGGGSVPLRNVRDRSRKS